MSQNDFVIDNQTTPLFRSDLNSALQALASNSSGTTEPTTRYANQWWYDESTDTLKFRSEANDAWINIGTLDQSLNTFAPAGLVKATEAQAEAGTGTGLMDAMLTKAAVPALIANTTAGSVGSFAWCVARSTATRPSFGDTRAGSGLSPHGFFVGYTSTLSAIAAKELFSNAAGTALTGTWRCLGNTDGATASRFAGTLFLRIS